MFGKYRAEFVFLLLILVGVFLIWHVDFNKSLQQNVPVAYEVKVDTLWHGSLRADLNSLLDRKHTLGFNGTVLVSIDDDFVYEGMRGYADHANDIKITSKTRFQIGSVSKQFTALAILQLYANGKLSLTDSINKFFPNLHFQGFTIHQLLVHRSGLSNYVYFIDKLVKDKSLVVTNRDVIELWNLHKPLAYYPPNKRFDYSNSGYMLLASIIEKVSGMSYPKYMEQNVFEPLGMRETFVCESGTCDTFPNIAKGYNSRWRIVTEAYLNGTYGDKGIYTTARDLLRWNEGIGTGLIIPYDTLKLAFKPMGRPKGAKHNYGYGWRTDERNGVTILYHAGWWQGFKSFLVRVPKYKLTIIVLKNTKTGSMFSRQELLRLVIDKYLEKPVEAAVPDLPQFNKCVIPDNLV